MKAMLLRAQGPIETNPLRLAEAPDPQPGPGQILVRVSACGLCHTDLHIVEGELPPPKLPLIPGHQVVGVVDAIGPGAGLFSPGDRVGVPWLYSTCGVCSFCRTGRENLCTAALFTGYQVDGGYAQYMVVQETFAYRLPEGFSDLQAAPLLCAGIIGYRALRLSGIEAGGRL
ncbi:MAG: alcohol dehydrogenase catalytic domain-containing protein, partial [Dehalococcoidia bacterium]|nr:alcohol dehydrogenase catalytic domain-containing protein [Dehalococcoidia bacterium]